MALPKHGVSLVAENFGPFGRVLDAANNKINDAAKRMRDAAKSLNPFSGGLDKAGLSIEDLRGKLLGFIQANVPFGNVLAGILDKLVAIPLPALAAGAAIAGLTVGFVALGNRGAPLVGLGRAFDNLTASIGLTSTALLQDLRKAAAGTISDFKLIETANIALSGATGQLGVEIGKNLPALLNLARQQAKVTGKDVDFLFTSIIEGIRKSSPLRLDNAGLIISETAAYDAYAKSVGKSADQLTQEEKGIAVLNATLEAGNAALAQAGNLQETNAEKLSRVNATITNIFDSIAIAVQPAFATVLDVVNRVLGVFQQLTVAIAPIVGSISSIITDVLGGAFNIILDLIQPIIDVVTGFLPYISILFQGIANVVNGVVTVIQNVVGGIVGFLKDVAKNFFGLDFDNLAPNLFNGAARVFGSFANGIIKVANTLIFPAVTGIAQFIADLLIGFSPPKEGPLSVIDKGGENIMLAWLDGLTGVSLDPVNKVAEEVSLALGDIGKSSLSAVEKRLAVLDKALLPFQQRLDIIKSRFDAIATPAKAALDAIDRQIADAQTALLNGDQAALATIQRLDAQRAAIQANLDAQQGVVDKYQIQLALAQAQQAQERSLLNIRKAQFGAVQKTTAAAQKAGKLGAEKEKKGEAQTPTAAIGGIPTIATPSTSVLDLIGGQSAVNEAIAGIQDAFAGEIDASALGDFQTNQGLLQEQLDRIASVDLGAKLADKFSGLTDLFDPEVEGSPANVIRTFVTTLTADQDTPGSVASFFAALPGNVVAAAEGLWTQLDESVFAPVRNFLTGEGEGTLSGIIDGAVQFFTDLPSRIIAALQGFGASIYGALVTPVISTVNGLIGLVEGGIKGFIGGIADFIQGIVDGLGDFAPQFLRDAATNLRNTANGIAFARISTELPDFLQPPQAATGGTFTRGMLSVGERGREVIANASRVSVFPHEFVKGIETLGSILAAPPPMMVPAASNAYDYSSMDQSINANFYGVQGSTDVMRRMSVLRARRR